MAKLISKLSFKLLETMFSSTQCARRLALPVFFVRTACSRTCTVYRSLHTVATKLTSQRRSYRQQWRLTAQNSKKIDRLKIRIL